MFADTFDARHVPLVNLSQPCHLNVTSRRTFPRLPALHLHCWCVVALACAMFCVARGEAKPVSLSPWNTYTHDLDVHPCSYNLRCWALEGGLEQRMAWTATPTTQ